MKLPELFIAQLKTLLDEASFTAYLDSFEDDRSFGLRLNRLKAMTVESIPFNLTPIPWTDNGYYYQPDDLVTKSPLYYAGAYYVQEPSAMSPAAYLPISEGDRVLDLCAAPGGKSTELGAKLMNSGLLVANDISYSRAQVLLKNLENFGIKNSIVTNEESDKLAKTFEGYFDKILIDAPCSGEGMFRKDPGMVKEWSPEKPAYYCEIQKVLLHDASKMLKPGGLIMYSTCTFSPIENEVQIDDFLQNHEGFELIKITPENGFTEGLTRIEGVISPTDYCVRLWPFKLRGEGHFMALLRKKESIEVNHTTLLKSNYQTNEAFERFIKEYTHLTFEPHLLWQNNDRLYYLPHQCPDTKGIRVLRTGWLLGDIKKNRFEPSHALAVACDKHSFKQVIDLTHDDPRSIDYLKGFTLDEVDGEGWMLVCVDGLGLGLGKAQNGSLKNKYHADWRMK